MDESLSEHCALLITLVGHVPSLLFPPLALSLRSNAANIALEDTVERIFVGKSYCDQSLGLFIIRGDNIVLVGGMV